MGGGGWDKGDIGQTPKRRHFLKKQKNNERIALSTSAAILHLLSFLGFNERQGRTRRREGLMKRGKRERSGEMCKEKRK